MQHFSKKIHSIIIALMFLGVAIAVLVAISLMVKERGEALRESMQLIADEQRFEKQYTVLAASVRETVEEREMLEKAILRGDRDTIELLSTLDNVAAGQGVELTTNSLTENEGTGRFGELTLVYTVSGSEKAVMRMLEIFEHLPYHGHITSVSVRRSTSAGTGATEAIANLTLVLTIEKYD